MNKILNQNFLLVFRAIILKSNKRFQKIILHLKQLQVPQLNWSIFTSPPRKSPATPQPYDRFYSNQ